MENVVVLDATGDARWLSSLLLPAGWIVRAARTREEAWQAHIAQPATLLLCSLDEAPADVLEFLGDLERLAPNLVTAVLTGVDDLGFAVRALSKQGLLSFLAVRKPAEDGVPAVALHFGFEPLVRSFGARAVYRRFNDQLTFVHALEAGCRWLNVSVRDAAGRLLLDPGGARVLETGPSARARIDLVQ